MARRLNTAETVTAALLLVMSCMVFIAPGLQSASAESTATVVETLEVPVEEEEETETVVEAEQTETVVEAEQTEVKEEPAKKPRSPEPVSAKHRGPTPNSPIPKDGAAPETEAPGHGDGAAVRDSMEPEGKAPRDDVRGQHGADGDKKNPPVPEDEVVAFGDLKVFEGEEEEEAPEVPEHLPAAPPAPRTVVTVDVDLLQSMLLEMALATGLLSDDTDLIDRENEVDDDADEDEIAVVEEEPEEIPLPATGTAVPGEFYTPHESNFSMDTFRASQVVSQLA